MTWLRFLSCCSNYEDIPATSTSVSVDRNIILCVYQHPKYYNQSSFQETIACYHDLIDNIYYIRTIDMHGYQYFSEKKTLTQIQDEILTLKYRGYVRLGDKEMREFISKYL